MYNAKLNQTQLISPPIFPSPIMNLHNGIEPADLAHLHSIIVEPECLVVEVARREVKQEVQQFQSGETVH
jgi:hypothetical protein